MTTLEGDFIVETEVKLFASVMLPWNGRLSVLRKRVPGERAGFKADRIIVRMLGNNLLLFSCSFKQCVAFAEEFGLRRERYTEIQVSYWEEMHAHRV